MTESNNFPHLNPMKLAEGSTEKTRNKMFWCGAAGKLCITDVLDEKMSFLDMDGIRDTRHEIESQIDKYWAR